MLLPFLPASWIVTVVQRTGGNTHFIVTTHKLPLISPTICHCHPLESLRDMRRDKEGNGGIDEDGEQRAGSRWKRRVRYKIVSQELWEVGKERNEGRLAARVLNF